MPRPVDRFRRRGGAIGLLVAWLGGGCASVGSNGIADVVATVKGRVRVSKETPGDSSPSCVLELRRPERAEAVRTVKVEGAFVQNYGLAPGRYFFVVACEGTSQFRSQEYDIKDMSYMRTPIDLGVIALQ